MASEEAKRIEPPFFRCGSKPYIRWWWLAGPFRERDIEQQFGWVQQMGFGGVELAWLWPRWLIFDEASIPGWLSSDLPAFNAYLEDVCGWMQAGRTVSELAVYLPNEDMWMSQSGGAHRVRSGRD
jgi:hypothetical protein